MSEALSELAAYINERAIGGVLSLDIKFDELTLGLQRPGYRFHPDLPAR